MSRSDVRMLVISPPCLTAVNRAIYRFLASEYGLTVHLVLPSRSRVGADWKVCEKPEDEPVEVTLLDVVGTHPNLQRLSGLERLIASWRPTHVLVDNNPGTLMARQVVRCVGRLGSARPKVWLETPENQLPDALRDLRLGIRQLKPQLIAGPLIASWLRRSVIPNVDCMLTLSDAGTQVMEELGLRGRVTKIPLGFDRRLFYPQSPAVIASTRARINLTLPTIAYFGRLVPEKGLHILLSALASVKDLPWQFLIDRFSAYQTPYVASVKAQLDSFGLAERVIFFDANHSEMPDYMNAADFVVLPSVSTPKWKEQYGRVVPEAMACGKIVIGSSSGAIPEIIGDAGYIFPEGDSRALGALLRTLLTQDQDPSSLASMRDAAFRRSHTYYSVDRQASIMAELAQADSLELSAA